MSEQVRIHVICNDGTKVTAAIQQLGPTPFVSIWVGRSLSILTRDGLDNAIADIDKIQTALRGVREELDAMKAKEVS